MDEEDGFVIVEDGGIGDGKEEAIGGSWSSSSTLLTLDILGTSVRWAPSTYLMVSERALLHIRGGEEGTVSKVGGGRAAFELLLDESGVVVVASMDSPAKDTTERARLRAGGRGPVVDAATATAAGLVVPMKLVEVGEVVVAGGEASGKVGGVSGTESPGVAVTRRSLQLLMMLVESAFKEESRLSWLDLLPPLGIADIRENIGDAAAPNGLLLEAAAVPRLCR